ncbi:hypothetical protein TMatcc_008638 [Talaromyces marneffei ATCC 18224]|uniref:Rhodopsin domain-containing protein n=1 Tax=Talaromyces marneffei (strain ATCC 18224 / CBS 334.59 / QM 7333) TaxID=441960 RepID=B6QLF8_TALMQ|nr:uncharacterized protein EYB26_007966 [Talaromyces marneffei]EEA21935.1 hypothetical protein PMAA_057240 [Talaromyces marneffei ATCC 18224]KAE8550594.1 hypothetical protein EYB25_006822 [Talaromyces marneffei]QGA20264.1 hypothetical protein EYB26_007966 [Talaromyces marneffei]
MGTRFLGDLRTPVVDVMTWFLLVVVIIAVLIRLGTKIWIFRKLHKDDYIMILSAIFDIGQVICVSIAGMNGYGRHIKTLSEDQIDLIQKCTYAQHELIIMTMTLSKTSFIMFVKSITAVPLDHKVAQGLMLATWGWAISFLISGALQCKLPEPWNYLDKNCFNQRIWNDFFSIGDIVTDVGIVIYTMIIIVRIRTKLSMRMGLAIVFGMRVLVIVAIVVHITTLNMSFAANDSTYKSWVATIASQIAICMSNVTACSPQFKPFLESLQSSGMRLDTLTIKKCPPKKDGTSGSYLGSKGISFAIRSLTGRGRRNDNMPYVKTVVTANPSAAPDWDGASETSESRIIRETRTWTVIEERRRAQSTDPEESV